MQNISILGCGWLGLPLAKKLLNNSFTIKGSTTSENKLEILNNEGITPFHISLHENEVEGDIAGFLANAEILIIDVPPKAKSGEDFAKKIRTLLPYIEQSGTDKILFISSTSVYADDAAVVTEDTSPNPVTDSGKQLVATERLLQENKSFKTTVLRFGGLIGEDRHPVKHLAGRENLPDGDAPVNLVHRDDCIGSILKVIESNAWGETFNVVAPQHPTRKDYYTKKATEAGLPLPGFLEKERGGKIIDSTKIQELTGFTFTAGI
ncbi:SDR family oxidoreductase [Flavobacterium album]|nr:SDR family oxidoreductase [Flavobacterium album]